MPNSKKRKYSIINMDNILDDFSISNKEAKAEDKEKDFNNMSLINIKSLNLDDLSLTELRELKHYLEDILKVKDEICTIIQMYDNMYY